jgi:subtilisin family serine protease
MSTIRNNLNRFKIPLILTTAFLPLFSSIAGDQSMSGNGQRRIQIPDSLARKLGSGLLEMQVNERLQAAAGQAQVNAADKIRTHIYMSAFPTNAEKRALGLCGADLYPETWIPPVEDHVYGFFLADIPSSLFLKVMSLPFVKRIETAEQTVMPQNNNAYRAIKADLVWARGYTGAGVKVAILDSGLDSDPVNPDLPASFEKMDYSAYPALDGGIENTVTGHGTAITGTLLGRGILSASNSGNGGGAYRGMAPDANLVFLKIGRDSDGGATFAAMEAALTAAVDVYHSNLITLSYGGWGVYNDGSESTDQVIDACYRKGVPVFVSAGNEANSGRHYSNVVNPHDSSGYIQVNVMPGVATGTRLKFNLVWRDGPSVSNALTIRYYDANGNRVPYIVYGTTTESLRGTESLMSYHSNLLNSPATFYLKVTNSSSNAVFYHLYERGESRFIQFQYPDPNFTICCPSTADHAMSVGAWTTRKIWQASNGSSYQSGGAPETADDIASFSSRGPRIDFAQKPDITAPGTAIISIRDRDVNTAVNASWVDNDGVTGSGDANYYVVQGTSLACPVAAGAAALLLQKNPQMSPQEVYDTLTGHARSDSYTGAVPNPVWGSGKMIIDSAFVSLISVEARIFLEGPYSASGDTMRCDLRRAGAVPLTSPYTDDPRSVASMPAKTVDWVLIQLRSAPTGAAVVSKSVLLRNDGRITADDGVTTRIVLEGTPGNYYLVIQHRNHLAVMSAAAVSLSQSGSTVYDFTSGGARYYGTGGAKEIEPGVWGMIGGNANNVNNVINILDASAIKLKFTKSGYLNEDVDLNKVVNILDFALMKNNLTKSSRVP